MAQWLACWAHNSKVGGSKPLSATIVGLVFAAVFGFASADGALAIRNARTTVARLAQLVERQPFKLVVVGSSPTVGGFRKLKCV